MENLHPSTLLTLYAVSCLAWCIGTVLALNYGVL